MSAITFDNEAHWDGEKVTFWANYGTDRIRCQIGRKSINGLPGFTNAASREIDMRMSELIDLIKPNAARMILAGKYKPDLAIKTVQVYWEVRV